MALYANCPYAQAPGMGLNAFFAYTVVLTMGYTWQQGLAIVFLSGIFSILITISKIRIAIVDAIPESMKQAVSAGIGLFIAFIGFRMPESSWQPQQFRFCNFTAHNTPCNIGLFITGILLAKNKRCHTDRYFCYNTYRHTNGVVIIPRVLILSRCLKLGPTFMQLDFKGLMEATGNYTWSIFVAIVTLIISFSFVDIFDTIGTLVGTGTKAGMLDENGKVIRIDKALISDSVATSIGAVLGTSNTTTYVESAAGVMEGGRTGLTAFVTAVMFIAALFIAPIAGLVPSAATAPALIIVGVMMMSAVKEIDFEDFTEALPAFLTIIIMPLSYGIANGIAVGFIAYPVMKLAVGKGKEVHPIVYILAVLFALRFFTMAG